jgi:uncharacterized protein YlzI (FlbEa/FlbD family)
MEEFNFDTELLTSCRSKLEISNEQNLKYLNGDEPLYNTPRIKLDAGDIWEKIYIQSGTIVQIPNGKKYVIGEIVSFDMKSKAYMGRVVIVNNGIFSSTNKLIPIFDKNGKLIVKIILE